MNNTNNASARMSFDIARQLLFNAWIESFKFDIEKCWNWVNGRKLSQGEIRLEVELNINSTIFTFGVNENQKSSTGVIFNTEKRLPLQDSLIASEYGLFVGAPASRVDTEWELRTYGNTGDFTAAQVAAINGTLFSNGSLELKVNNDVIIPYRQLFNHWYRPQTQQTAALGPASPQDQIRGAEDGMITYEPNILFIGTKNYVPSILLPAAMAAVAEFQRAILIYRGVYAQNSTSVN